MEPRKRESELDNWWRPKGVLPVWVSCVVVIACAITVAIAIVGAQLMWQRTGHRNALDAFWLRDGVGIGLAGWIAVSFAPRWNLSRLLRVAVLLPVAHLIWMIAGWQLWMTLSPQLPRVAVVASLPMWALLAGGAAWFGLASKLIARRRDRAQAIVMMALLSLLLVGLWLPIASAIWCNGMTDWRQWNALEAALFHPADLVAFVLAPPMLISIAITALSLRRPDELRRVSPTVVRRWLVHAGTVVLVIAMITRVDPSFPAALVYVNFVHVLVALAILTTAALAILGVAIWTRTRKRDFATRHFGDVVCDDEAVGCVEITSWLRGPTALLRPFVVATAAGDVLVPRGAELVASIPPATTALRTGDSVEVLRRGDRVVLGGYVEPAADHPFRASSALVPGPAGVIVRRVDDEGFGFGHVALAMWRPCVAYLLIVVAIAIPALLAVRAS